VTGNSGSVTTENCFNDPKDCGPCPTIQNISDPNISAGTCDQTQCAQGVCTAGQCSNPSACEFNCGSAHYGGTSPGLTVESDAVDFVVDSTNCSVIATLANNICPPGGANFVSYALETLGTLIGRQIPFGAKYRSSVVPSLGRWEDDGGAVPRPNAES
jgi:hypothetical protein